MNAPIRVRMTAWYVALLAFILVAVGAFVLLQLHADLLSATDRRLLPALNQIATGYHNEGLPEFRDQSATVLAQERAASQVLAPDGTVVRAWGDAVSTAPMLPAARLPRRGGPHLLTARLNGIRFRIAAQAVTRRGASRIVVAAASLVPVDRSVHRVMTLLLLALPAALAMVGAGGWWLARRAMRPIDRMTTTAERIGPEDLQARVAVPPVRDEVARLGRTLNTMLDRIQRGAEDQQRLIADTSHEFRTPLATMRTELDVSLRSPELPPAAREVLESAREEVDHLSAMVDDLLLLARIDERGLPGDREPVDLAVLAQQEAQRLAPRAEQRGVTVVTEGAAAPALANEQQLGRALRNLLDNAIKHSPEGGRVLVRTSATNGHVAVSVEDAGPGVPEPLRERIFDRFYRADGSRTRATGGSGLGLAITREIVSAHGGRIAVTGRAPTGSEFSITLPAYAPPR